MILSGTRRAVLAAVCVAVTAHPLAAPNQLVSGWADQVPTIDGVASEWIPLGALDETQMSIAIRNDERSLYLVIASSDYSRRLQLLTAGIIVWFDEGGGKKKRFGIRVPGIGHVSAGGGRLGRTPRQDSVDLDLPPYFEILGPKDDDRRRIDRASTRSIQVGRDQEGSTLVLELQVPLAMNDGAPQAIGTRPGQVIGLGFETPKIDRPEEPPDARVRGGGGMSGGLGGRGGGRRPGGGGWGAGRERIERAEPLKLWTTVRLAAEKVGG